MSAKDGKPCRKCGSNEWYTSGACAPCTRESNRKWREANPEKASQSVRRWQKDNAERVAEAKRQWRRNNPEKAAEKYQRERQAHPRKKTERERLKRQANAERNRQWQKNNPERVAARSARYRTSKTKAGGSYTAAEFSALIEHYGGRCLCCGRDDVRLTADHVVPVSKGGTSNIDNIQPLCHSCNSGKRDRTIDYRPGKGLGRWIQKKLFG